jgi:hypothetical protein
MRDGQAGPVQEDVERRHQGKPRKETTGQWIKSKETEWTVMRCRRRYASHIKNGSR